MIRNAPSIIETWVGADGLPLVVNLKEVDGTVFDVTAYTVTLTATFDGATKINAATMTKTDAANGILTYQPTAAQIDTAGDYKARIWLTAGGLRRPARDLIIRVNPA